MIAHVTRIDERSLLQRIAEIIDYIVRPFDSNDMRLDSNQLRIIDGN